MRHTSPPPPPPLAPSPPPKKKNNNKQLDRTDIGQPYVDVEYNTSYAVLTTQQVK